MTNPVVLAASWGDPDDDGNITAQVIVQGNPGTVSHYSDDAGEPVEQTDITPIPFTFPASTVVGEMFAFIKANYK